MGVGYVEEKKINENIKVSLKEIYIHRVNGYK